MWRPRDRNSRRGALWCVLLALAAGCGRRASPSNDPNIHVILATYGYNCSATPGNATAKIRNRCDGRLNCDYRVEVSELGDPSPGCSKDFHVDYVCFEGARERRVVMDAEAAGNVVSLTCE